MKLTAATVRTLALPKGVSDKIFFDDELPRFGVRVRAGGSRTWIVQYGIGGKERKLPLGLVSALDPSKARSLAKDVLARVRLGEDPLALKHEARARANETLGAQLPRYLAFKRASLRPRSYAQVARHLTVHAKPLHNRPLATLASDRRGVAIVLAKVAEASGPVEANMVRSSLSACCRWLMGEGLLDGNPIIATNKAAQNGARKRVLSDAELKRVWNGLDDGRYGAIVKLLVLTGLRREEIGGLRWDEIDLGNAVVEIPASRMKANRPHVIPLSGPALEILRRRPRTGDYVFGRGRGFQGWSARRKALDAVIGGARPDFVLHDLRRLASTVMHEKLGIQPHIVERVLAHVGHQRGVAGTYNKAEYLAERRRALVRWADYVLAVVTGEESTAQVVQLMK